MVGGWNEDVGCVECDRVLAAERGRAWVVVIVVVVVLALDVDEEEEEVAAAAIMAGRKDGWDTERWKEG